MFSGSEDDTIMWPSKSLIVTELLQTVIRDCNFVCFYCYTFMFVAASNLAFFQSIYLSKKLKIVMNNSCYHN